MTTQGLIVGSELPGALEGLALVVVLPRCNGTQDDPNPLISNCVTIQRKSDRHTFWRI